jgi:hypothetical protein
MFCCAHCGEQSGVHGFTDRIGNVVAKS